MSNSKVAGSAAMCFVALILFVALAVGGVAGCKGFNRAQKRADANNNVKVTTIQIRNAQQQARVVAAQDETIRARAEQRYLAAVGVKRAQVEIAKTLTPLYVQFEAVQAQLAMANSPNHTVIYVPAGTNGTPVITQDGNAP